MSIPSIQRKRIRLVLDAMLPFYETNRPIVFTGFDKYLKYKQLETIKRTLRNNNVITLAKASNYMKGLSAEWHINKEAFERFYSQFNDVKELPPEIKYEFDKDDTTKEIPHSLKINSKYRKKLRFNKISDVESAVHNQCPWLKEYQEKLQQINKMQPELPENRMNINVVHQDGYLQKISVRYSNNKVSLKCHNSEERQIFCFQHGLNYAYDVCSSIHRITYLMNTGIWLPRSSDLYEMYFNAATHNNGKWDENVRDVVKQFMQRCYFDTSRKSAVAHCKSAYVKEYKDYDDAVRYSSMCGKLYDAMRVIVGKTYDSEIFLHESCIMIDIIYELVMNRGCKVFPVYDGIYFDKDIKDIEQIAERCALNYYKKVENTKICLSHYQSISQSINPVTTISNTQYSIDGHSDTKCALLVKRRNKGIGSGNRMQNHYFDELKEYGLVNITNDDEFRAKAYAAGLSKSKVCRLLKYSKGGDK